MEESLSKLLVIKDSLNEKFLEREKEVEAMLIALLSRQHLLLIGPAGTAKSALIIELAKSVRDANCFQWLLTRFSTPEEVFGPLSLKALEQGIYRRNTETKMPEADVVFLDEIFKANSAILNSLLTLINERLFYNGGIPTQVPLISVIGASNEYPEEGEGLEALFDRFLLRLEVDYIAEENNFLSMLKMDHRPQTMPLIEMEELLQLQLHTGEIAIPEEVYASLALMRKELSDEGIRPSDRRFKQSLSLLQAKALLCKRQSVQSTDMIILENVLWETVDQKETASFIVRRHSQDTVIGTLDRVQSEAIEVFNVILQDHSTDAGREAVQKMNVLAAELKVLADKSPVHADTIHMLLAKVKAMKEEILSYTLEPMYVDAAATMRKFRREASKIFYKS